MKNFVILLLGICWSIGIWLGSPSSQGAIAAPDPTTSNAEMATVSQTEVARELQAIPPGFYALFDIDALKTKVDRGAIFLVDVRQPAEYDAGHIEGAINIPLRKLADNLDRIPRDRPVVLYCSTGYRTGIGVLALHLLGYENVQGFPPSYEGWKAHFK